MTPDDQPVRDEHVSDEQVEIEPWHAVWSDEGTWPGQDERLAYHRRAELRDALAAMLADTAGRWVDGEGFAFSPEQPCGLQGTEMWLSIAYLLADHLGESDGLSWRPQGVHRLEPVGAPLI